MEPVDPDDFEMVVEVLNDEGELKTFDVSAKVDIHFIADEKKGGLKDEAFKRTVE